MIFPSFAIANLQAESFPAQHLISEGCAVSLPLTPAIIGVFSTELECRQSIGWGIRAGAAVSEGRRVTPFVKGQMGIGFDIPPKANAEVGHSPSVWRTQASVSYVFLHNSAFEGLESSQPAGNLSTPALQQWNLLSQSDVSFEIIRNTERKTSLFDSYRLKIWQTIPRTWRFTGALRDTRDAEMSGVTLLAAFNHRQWTGSAGVGRGMISTGKITAGFFYPAAEISYIIGHFPANAETALHGMTKQ